MTSYQPHGGTDGPAEKDEREQDRPGDERPPVPPGEEPPAPVKDPPSPAEKAPIDEGPKGPKMYV